MEKKDDQIPKTTKGKVKDLLKKVNFPIVMKFPEGTQGKGVMFADSISSASSLLDALGALNQPFIIQEYVETGGTDVRALVVGDKVVASMRRKAQTEEKRANIHAGGTGEPVILSPESNKLALNTAKALGTEICGVDILEGPLGPVVIEANISPGLQGLSEVSTIDIPDQIARFLYRKTEEVVNKHKQTVAAEVMKEISINNNNPNNNSQEHVQEIISSISLRGDRIILPVIANKIARFNDDKEYSIKVKKGKIEIEEM